MSVTTVNWPASARLWARASLARRLQAWLAKARSRRQLAALDDRLLRDIGVTPGAARREIAKPFWR